jgi:hypothetical protein
MRSIRIAPRERTKHNRARVRVTRPPRKLNAAERAAVEERLRRDGILPRANERMT